MGVIASVWGSPEAAPEQGLKDGTGSAIWQSDEWAPRAEASASAKAGGPEKDSVYSKLERQGLVGMEARQEVRRCSGREGWARRWPTSVPVPGVRLHLAHSGSARKTPEGEWGGCVERSP